MRLLSIYPSIKGSILTGLSSRGAYFLTAMSAPRSTSSTPKTCRFYAKGDCRYGAKCKNLHLDVRVRRLFTLTLLSTLSIVQPSVGLTGKGARNGFVETSAPKPSPAEDVPSSSTSQHPPRSNNRRGSRSANQQMCFALIRKGSCSKGAQCPYSHDTNASPSSFFV